MLLTPIPKGTKAASGEAGKDSELEDASHRANPELPPSLPSRSLLLTERGFLRLAWGGGRLAPFTGARKPDTLGLGDYSTRRAQATRALALTRSGEGGFWRRRRQDLGPRT